MSPGSVTERLVLFVGHYRGGDRRTEGGGHEAEGEDIAVLEVGPDEAGAIVDEGCVRDAKKIMLLQWLVLHERSTPVCATIGADG